MIERNMSKQSDGVAKGFSFSELTTDAPFVPPSPLLRTGIYDLLGIFQKSMETGASVTENLYVPKMIWFQSGVRFQAYPVKMEVFEVLDLALGIVLVLDMESLEEFERGLVEFRLVTEHVQNKLAQHLAYIHSCKTSVKEKKN